MNNSNNKQYWYYVFQWKINANDCEARPHIPSSLSSPRSRDLGELKEACGGGKNKAGRTLC